jgi:hypothetical protein
MILALIFSLGTLPGCDAWIPPVSSPAGTLDGLRPTNLDPLCALIRVPVIPIPARAPAGNDRIEGVAKEEEEDSPDPGEGGVASLAFFMRLDLPHPSLLSSSRRWETALLRHWPSSELRC